ncbi:hypothetical protein IDM40_17590 [Nocardiopsis sp. HNM0947]|uniref:Integral membrane protein n=1 Tax=Nocardiopsis coralli TaxID=2772213 RepID=A0ABR9P9I6_9ACTN|nr:hypothetical protein [Nocardiopsis coralli]MBE3000501.1 hypothetical protein [Nocardiopsis coralli]
MNPPMPTTAKAARIVLFVTAGVLGVVLVVNLLNLVFLLSAPDGAEVLAGAGTTPVLAVAGLALGLASTVCFLLGGLRLGRGGSRSHLVVRILVGLGGLLTIANALVVGQLAYMGVISAMVALGLVQTRSARGWFEATGD